MPARWGSEPPNSATLGSTPPPRVGGVADELGAPRARQAPPPAGSPRRAVMPHAALSSLVLLSLATAIVAGKLPLPRPARAQSPFSHSSSHALPSDHPAPISLARWLPKARPGTEAKAEKDPISRVSASSAQTP